MRYSYQLMWWYRHETDTDQSIRQMWQMSSGVANEAEALAEVSRMQAQGYRVQRLLMHLVCSTCAGEARIAKRRKNARKDSRRQYACYYVNCKACQGDGWTEAAELRVD